MFHYEGWLGRSLADNVTTGTSMRDAHEKPDQSSSAERLIAAPQVHAIQTPWAYNSIRRSQIKALREPFAPHPLFASFIEAAVAQSRLV